MYHALLVVSHFAIAAALVLTTRWWPVPWDALLLSLPGIMLAVWAWLVVGPRQLRVHPATTRETQFIQSGPYAVVRHPMYSGTLWFTAAILLSGFVWWRALLWFALLLVLLAKATEEERAMRDRFHDYPHYKQKVGRLFPRLRGSK